MSDCLFPILCFNKSVQSWRFPTTKVNFQRFPKPNSNFLFFLCVCVCVCVVCFYDYTPHTFCNYFQFPTKRIRASVFACVSILYIFFEQAKQGLILGIKKL
jgi:hypothetical protein